MSDFIRDAVIRIRYETQKSKLESPELSQTVKSAEQVAASTTKTAAAEQQIAAAAQQTLRSYEQRIAMAEQASLKQATASAKSGSLLGAGVDFAEYEKQQPRMVAGLQEVSSKTEEAARVQEDFGEKSNRSYIRSIGGITQLSRGIALLAANGSEDSQKLLQNIVAIQGGVDLVRGSLQLMRLGPEFGAIAAAVTVGAGAWMLYRGEVDAVKKSLEATAAAAKKEHDRLTELAAKQESITSEARMEKTGLAVGGSDSKSATERALAETQSRVKEIQQTVSDAETGRQRAATEEDAWRKRLKEVQQDDSSLYHLGQWVTSKLGLERDDDLMTRKGAEAHAHEQAARKAQVDALQRTLPLEEDEKRLMAENRDNEIKRRREQEQSQIESLNSQFSPTDPVAKSKLAQQTAIFDAHQRALARQLDETGTLPAGSGFTYGRSSQQQQALGIHQSAEGDIQRIQRDQNAGISAIVDIIAGFKNQMESLKSKLDAGNTR